MQESRVKTSAGKFSARVKESRNGWVSRADKAA
jgi:hypothetical protein